MDTNQRASVQNYIRNHPERKDIWSIIEDHPEVEQEYRFELEGEEDGQREDDRSLIWEFLDLSSSKEKMDFLQKKKSEITEEFIGIAAQSLDFVENDGTVEERYEAVMQYLRTVMRYESGRLR